MKIYHIISTAMLLATTSADTENQKLRGAADARLLAASQGENSCTGGNNECRGNEGTIGDEACQGDIDDVYDVLGVCQFNEGTIHDRACNEHKGSGVSSSCYENKGKIGVSACNGKDACLDNRNGASIGKSSCNGDYTCRFNFGSIGDDACNGDNACYNNRGFIEPGCCNEDNWIPECYGNSGVIEKLPGSNMCGHGKKKIGESCERYDNCHGYTYHNKEECDQQNNCMRGYACLAPRSTGGWTYEAPKVCCKSKETVGFLTLYGWSFFCKE